MKKSTLFLILLLIAAAVQSQNGVTVYLNPSGYSPMQLLYKSGLGTDASDNKWVAFDSIGLGKFDGTNWTMYNTANSQLPSNKMTSLYVINNTIYAGTANGLGIFNGNSTWTIYNTSNGLLNNHVNAINTRAGNLWIGTNKGIAKFDGSTWQYYHTLNSNIISDTVTAIEFAGVDTVWIGTSKGLSCLYNNSFINYDSTNSGLHSNYIYCLKRDINNHLWIGTKAGAYIMSNIIIEPLSGFINIPVKNDSLSVTSITINSHNEIFIPGILNPISTGLNNSEFMLRITPVDYSYLAYYMDIFFNNYNNNYSYYISAGANNLIWSTGSGFGDCGKLESLYYIDDTMCQIYNYLSINNIKARFNSCGQLFWDLYGLPTFEVPQGSGKNTLFSGALWVGGKYLNNQLHIAAETYMPDSNDFYPGPVMDSAYYTQEQIHWNRVWKIKKSDVDYHRTHCFDPGYVASPEILDWPANGNTALGQAKVLAPFKDWNNDSIYDPYAGDFPLIKGDEAVFFIFNDDMGIHHESKGKKLKIEVQAMAYASECTSDSALWNTIFLNYKIINRSSKVYTNTYVGLFVDTELGDGTDDYIASDVKRGAFYVYNGDDFDGSTGFEGYGANPPAQAVVFLSGPYMNQDGLDNSPYSCNEAVNGHNFGNGIPDDEHFGLCGFMSLYNVQDTASELYNYLRSIWDDGTHLQYWGNGYGGSGPLCNYMYPGNSDTCNWGTMGVPVAHPPYWTEANAGNLPYDRIGLGSAGSFTFLPGQVEEVDLAFVFGRDYSATGAMAAIPVMDQRIDSIRSYFNKDITPCGEHLSGINKAPQQSTAFNIYPNPASDYIIVETPQKSGIEIYNLQGQLVKQAQTNAGRQYVDISGLAEGLYFIRLQSEKKVEAKKFVKK